MKAILLARVSTEEQREAGNSLPAQIERIDSYCKRKAFEVIGKFSFDESAYKDKRDEFDKLLEYVQEIAKKEKVAVCFDKVDRLSRSVFDKRVGLLYEMAIADQIELHFVSDGQIINNQMSAVEKFQFGMSLGLAKYYSDAIGDNVKRAFEQKLRNGEWTGTVRIGYLNVPLDPEKRLRKDIIIDRDRGHLIQKMFELYATGNYSIKTLRDEMTKLGLRSRNNKVLSPSLVHQILKDKFYIGIMTSKGREYPHKYAKIVSREVFERVQGIMASYRKKTIKYAAKPFVLRGMVHCEKCGGTITAELKKGLYVYYSCSNFKGKCKRVFVREEQLLEPIKDVLRNIQVPQKQVDKIITSLKENSDKQNLFHRNQIDQLTKEYDRLQTSVSRLLDLLIDASITQDEYDKKLKECKEKQHEVALRLEELTNADENYHITAATLFSLANRALEIFESSEVNEKRQLLNFLLQNCRLSGKNLAFELRSPFGLVLAHTHTNSLLHLLEEVRTSLLSPDAVS